MTNNPEDSRFLEPRNTQSRDLSLNGLCVKPRRPNDLLLRNRSESPSHHLNLSTRSSRKTKDVINELKLISGHFKYQNHAFVANFNDFIHTGPLGSGTCSIVFKVQHKSITNFNMAVKQMKQFSNSEEETQRILMDLGVITKSHDCLHIVQCYGIIYSPEIVWVGMEIMATCIEKLLVNVGSIPEKAVAKIAVAIIKALDYLKVRHEIIHRDVKPSNMLLSATGDIKLCDFGISGNLKDSIAQSHKNGCFGYMSPERFSKSSYDSRSDIWSLGISLIEMATGSFPYVNSKNAFEIIVKIVQEPSPSLHENEAGLFSDEFKEFIDRCLVKEYKKRAKYSELKEKAFYTTHDCLPYAIGFWMDSLNLNKEDNDAEPIVQSSELATPKVNLQTQTVIHKKEQKKPNPSDFFKEILNENSFRSPSNHTNSQPSSGYGSAGSDNSPNSTTLDSRPPAREDSVSTTCRSKNCRYFNNEKFYQERILPWEKPQNLTLTPNQMRKFNLSDQLLIDRQHRSSSLDTRYHLNIPKIDNIFTFKNIPSHINLKNP